jgi:hypothetical protein
MEGVMEAEEVGVMEGVVAKGEDVPESDEVSRELRLLYECEVILGRVLGQETNGPEPLLGRPPIGVVRLQGNAVYVVNVGDMEGEPEG